MTTDGRRRRVGRGDCQMMEKRHRPEDRRVYEHAASATLRVTPESLLMMCFREQSRNFGIPAHSPSYTPSGRVRADERGVARPGLVSETSLWRV
jgi:hypothetical protein